MRLFWMVMRYRDDALQQHPQIGDRGVFVMGEVGRRNEISQSLHASFESAETHAIQLSQQYPTETIIILEQKAIYELPSLPKPIKKKFNKSGELVPDES